MTFNEYIGQLEKKIQQAYTQDLTLEEREKLAAEFLEAQLKVSKELKNASLEARMRRTGVKAVKAAVYLAEIAKNEKKPSDVLLNALVDTNKLVQDEEEAYIQLEENANELDRIYNVTREAHTFFRQSSRGVQG